jgi:transcription initiation factor TFIID subunit 9B
MSDPNGPSTSGSLHDMPGEAITIRKILKSMGVEEYEPRVINMLLDFMYKYVSEVLMDAEAYSEQTGRAPGEVDTENVVLAIEARAAHSFVQQPSQEDLSKIASKINSQPLPKLKEKYGLRLPPDTESLVLPNWRVNIPKDKS